MQRVFFSMAAHACSAMHAGVRSGEPELLDSSPRSCRTVSGVIGGLFVGDILDLLTVGESVQGGAGGNAGRICRHYNRVRLQDQVLAVQDFIARNKTLSQECEQRGGG